MDLELPCFSKSDQVSLSKKQEPPTTCAVCLGKATGHHYDIASCNGCKSFFRRAHINKLTYTCKYSNDCFDDLELGKEAPKCRSCRFKKCVEVGMNPIAFQTDQKNIVSIEKPRSTIETQVGELIDQMIRLDVQSRAFRDSAFNPPKVPTLEDCVKNEISMLSIANNYGPMPDWPIDKSIFDEHIKNHEFEKKYHPILKEWRVFELLIQIELSKALPFFAKLSQSDRYYLMQDTIMMGCNLTKSFYSFEQKSDQMIKPDGLNYYDWPFPENDEFRTRIRDDISMRCLIPIMRNGLDQVEFVLLRALVLTNPAVPEISSNARKFLAKEQKKYNLALFRYVMATHGASGPARFASILGFVDILEHQQRDQRDLGLMMSLKSRKKHPKNLFYEIMKN